MLTKEVVVDQVECTASRIVQIRFRKQVVEDGKVLSYEYHRTSLEPGVPWDAQMGAVNDHLTGMGWPPCRIDDTARVAAIVAVEHTPAVIKAFQDAKLARG